MFYKNALENVTRVPETSTVPLEDFCASDYMHGTCIHVMHGSGIAIICVDCSNYWHVCMLSARMSAGS